MKKIVVSENIPLIFYKCLFHKTSIMKLFAKWDVLQNAMFLKMKSFVKQNSAKNQKFAKQNFSLNEMSVSF
jgi:hypothetical protein